MSSVLPSETVAAADMSASSTGAVVTGLGVEPVWRPEVAGCGALVCPAVCF